jgi:hypothetical protein
LLALIAVTDGIGHVVIVVVVVVQLRLIGVVAANGISTMLTLCRFVVSAVVVIVDCC